MKGGEEETRSRADAEFQAYVDLARKGDTPDVEEFVRSHPPELQHRLRRMIADYQTLRQSLGDTTPSIQPGRVLGDFELVRELGRGGMSVVWEAKQLSLQRPVALKLLLAQHTLSLDALQRFEREARAGGRLSHPGIVQTYGVGESEGIHWIAQELVPGGYTLADSLADLCEEDELPEGYFRGVAELFAKVAAALQYAHEQGVIHRDLKPSNILISQEDEPRVADFGLAKIQDELGISRTGDLFGTPYYMSPEQASAKATDLDHRTDIFSLSSTLFESLTLSRPFDGETSQDVFRKIQTVDAPDPQTICSRVPRDLAVICLKALAKDRDQRFASMSDLGADLRRFLLYEPIAARPPGVLYRSRRFVERHWRHFVSAAATILLLGIWYWILVAPLVGQTAVGKLRDADRLRAAGEHRAAAMLYDQGIEIASERRTPNYIASALRRGAIHCHLEVASELLQSNEHSLATQQLDIAERLFDTETSEGSVISIELALDGAILKALREDYSSIFDSFSTLRGAFDHERRASEIEKAASRIRSAILDRSDAAHRASVLYFGWAASSTAFWAPIAGYSMSEWLAEQDDDGVATIRAVLNGIRDLEDSGSELLAEQIFRNEGEWLAWLSPRVWSENAPVVAEIAGEALLPNSVRRLASRTLENLANLPPIVLETSDEGARDEDIEFVAVELWNRTSQLNVEEALREKVRMAMASLAVADDAEARALVDWLERSIGTPNHENTSDGRSPDEWRAWWKQNDGGRPSKWLADSASADRETIALEFSAVLERFLSSSGILRRRHHELLRLVAPLNTGAPVWPQHSEDEPFQLADHWLRLREGSDAALTFQVHFAHFAFRDGSMDPRMVFQVQRPMRVGDSFLLNEHVESVESISSWEPASLFDLLETSEVSPVSLGWRRSYSSPDDGGVIVDWPNVGIAGDSTQHRGADSMWFGGHLTSGPWADQLGVVGDATCGLDTGEVNQNLRREWGTVILGSGACRTGELIPVYEHTYDWDVSRRSTHLTVLDIEHGERRRANRSVDDWRARLASAIEKDARRVQAAVTAAETQELEFEFALSHRDQACIAYRWLLATYFTVPESADALERISRLIYGQSRWPDFASWYRSKGDADPESVLLAARLAAGDESALESELLLKGLDLGGYQSDWWSRLYQCAKDDRFRDLAIAEATRSGLPPRMWLTMAHSAETDRRPLERAVRMRVWVARTKLVRGQIKKWDLVILLGSYCSYFLAIVIKRYASRNRDRLWSLRSGFLIPILLVFGNFGFKGPSTIVLLSPLIWVAIAIIVWEISKFAGGRGRRAIVVSFGSASAVSLSGIVGGFAHESLLIGLMLAVVGIGFLPVLARAIGMPMGQDNPATRAWLMWVVWGLGVVPTLGFLMLRLVLDVDGFRQVNAGLSGWTGAVVLIPVFSLFLALLEFAALVFYRLKFEKKEHKAQLKMQ